MADSSRAITAGDLSAALARTDRNTLVLIYSSDGLSCYPLNRAFVDTKLSPCGEALYLEVQGFCEGGEPKRVRELARAASSADPTDPVVVCLYGSTYWSVAIERSPLIGLMILRATDRVEAKKR